MDSPRENEVPPVAAGYPDPFQLLAPETAAGQAAPEIHVFGKYKAVCRTDSKGHARPRNASPYEIVVDSTEGFIPLWAPEVALRWRFKRLSFIRFANQTVAMSAVRQLLGEAILAWEDAAPVKFVERRDAWDFEIVVRNGDDCDINGCVLASAFFPDAGRHELVLYPKLFSLSREEQIETLIHEVGHVFGLRHFFAQISERAWPSEVFGEHDQENAFSIMNYGDASILTKADKRDLKMLYQLAWNGELNEINGTPIRLVKPHHSVMDNPENKVSRGEALHLGVRVESRKQ